jgi:hypothetical protein
VIFKHEISEEEIRIGLHIKNALFGMEDIEKV